MILNQTRYIRLRRSTPCFAQYDINRSITAATAFGRFLHALAVARLVEMTVEGIVVHLVEMTMTATDKRGVILSEAEGEVECILFGFISR